MADHEFAPVTPGEMLREQFLREYGLSQNQLAKAIGISPNRIAEIVDDRRRISADAALRLGLCFGNSPEFWLNLKPATIISSSPGSSSAAKRPTASERNARPDPTRACVRPASASSWSPS